MKAIIVGGNFGDEPKESSVIRKMAEALDEGTVLNGGITVLNGGSLHDIINVDITPYDLVLWFPNMSNEIEKIYPRKKRGAVLICSKVMREGYEYTIAVSRIFRIHANAVLAIHSDEKPFTFNFIDALGNSWVKTPILPEVIQTIMDFYYFTKSSIRLGSKSISDEAIDLSHLSDFVELNKKVADKSEALGGRYFGNCSTRCEKLFPSTRMNDSIAVSKRNVDKNRLTTDDLVVCSLNTQVIEYNGLDKPSVDTPIQISIYNEFDGINFMIHGHYSIDDAPYTKEYFPCGDMREYGELRELIPTIGNCGRINLKNHGFLIFSDTLENLRDIVDKSVFRKREIGK